jgi:hypothetical protein
MEAVGSYKTSVHMCRPLMGLQFYSALPLQLSVLDIMVCIGRLFGCITLLMLKDVHKPEEPFLCRKMELVM